MSEDLQKRYKNQWVTNIYTGNYVLKFEKNLKNELDKIENKVEREIIKSQISKEYKERLSGFYDLYNLKQKDDFYNEELKSNGLLDFILQKNLFEHYQKKCSEIISEDKKKSLEDKKYPIIDINQLWSNSFNYDIASLKRKISVEKNEIISSYLNSLIENINQWFFESILNTQKFKIIGDIYECIEQGFKDFSGSPIFSEFLIKYCICGNLHHFYKYIFTNLQNQFNIKYSVTSPNIGGRKNKNFVKTSQSHKCKDGVTRKLYKKGENFFVKMKSKITGKFNYKKIKI